VLRRVNLCMDVVGDDGVEVDEGGAAHLAEVQQAVQLKEVGGSHELEDVPGLDRQLLRRAVVQVLHHHFKDLVSDVVDLEHWW